MKANRDHKTLVVLTGPTAVGKTQTSLSIARALGAEIISADARQFYHELKIGTAAPTPAELQQAKHHLTGHLSIFDHYNASIFGMQALDILNSLFKKSDYAVLTGGSGLYIDALCQGIDPMPDIAPYIRLKVNRIYQEQGIQGLREQLQKTDPEYFEQVDQSNPNRMMRGIEVFMATGRKYSGFRISNPVHRPFSIRKVILNRPRRELFHRINQRTLMMVEQGIIEEAIRFFPYRHLNALNTVGYKELFAWLENRTDLHTAIEKIQVNTRRYAKRQLTWFKKYNDASWFLPSETNAILNFIKSNRE